MRWRVWLISALGVSILATCGYNPQRWASRGSDSSDGSGGGAGGATRDAQADFADAPLDLANDGNKEDQPLAMLRGGSGGGSGGVTGGGGILGLGGVTSTVSSGGDDGGIIARGGASAGGAMATGGATTSGGGGIDASSTTGGIVTGGAIRMGGAPDIGGTTCQSGECTCSAGSNWCGTSCVDLKSDNTHCGVCGKTCFPGQRCSAGKCVCDTISCPSGCCDGETCAVLKSQDLLIDKSNCGSCGTVCSARAPSKATCVAGRCLVQLATGQNFSWDLFLNASWLYWGSARDKEVWRVSITGGIVETVFTFPNVKALAGDDANIYVSSSVNVLHSIEKVPYQSNSSTKLTAENFIIPDITVHNGVVYYLTGNWELKKVPVGGGASKVLANGLTTASIIAADGAYIYWMNATTDSAGGAIMKMPVNGGAITTLASGQMQIGRFAIDANSVYWTINNTSPSGEGANGAVKKVSINGGSITTLASGLDLPFSIAVDATHVYWSDVKNNGNVLLKVSNGGGPITTLATDIKYASQLVVDSTSIYWADYDANGVIMKLTPK